jgi:hypothetical protein
MQQDPVLKIGRVGGEWSLVDPTHKLLRRGALPGAFGYDLAADGFGALLANGADPLTLLPAAMPTSWMVNNKPISRVFQKWLIPPLCGDWEALVGVLSGLDPAGWLEFSSDTRAQIEAHVRALCIDGHGIAAVSKVLTLLCPRLMFLMDDAALWFLSATTTERPSTAETPQAGAEHFCVALDLFCCSVLENNAALQQIADKYPLSGLHPSQVFDRLIWFESWGWRLFRDHKVGAWWWVRDGKRQAIVCLRNAPPQNLPTPHTDPIDLPMLDAHPWRTEAQQALDGALPPSPPLTQSA